MKKMACSLAFIISALVLQLAAGSPAQANITYDYTGNRFANIGDINLGTNIIASVTFDSVVTNNFTGTVGEGDLVSWSITSANSVGTVTYANGGLAPLRNTTSFTFQNGHITEWYLFTGNFNSFFLLTAADPDEKMDFIILSFGTTVVLENYVQNNPGTWTTSAVPIPPTMLLLGTGLVGLAAFRRKRRA